MPTATVTVQPSPTVSPMPGGTGGALGAGSLLVLAVLIGALLLLRGRLNRRS